MRQSIPTAWPGGRKVIVAACIAAVVAVVPATVSAATPSWTIVPSPNTSTGGILLDVTCIGASNCWAVGSGNQALIEHNTGSGWVIYTSPNPNGLLFSVTCVNASDCWAVGDMNSSSLSQSLIEHYNGTNWAIVPSPSPGVAPGGTSLHAVKCVNASNCWAAGAYDSGGSTLPLIEQYNGTSWVVVPNSVSNASLEGVACLSLLGECWAVGGQFGSACANPRDECTLIEHNTGSGWVVVPSPKITTGPNFLNGVTCVSATNCWAAGGYGPNRRVARILTLTEHYDGSSWTIVPSPNFGTSRLADVSCASATDCWVVGYYGAGGVAHTLTEHNTGAGWAVVKSPNATSLDNVLSGVKCLGTHHCWTVGSATATSGAANTLVEYR